MMRSSSSASPVRLIDFMNVELSAFYFDIRKDALYCDAPSSIRRKAALQVVRHLFDRIVTWLAPDAAVHDGGSMARPAQGCRIGPS